MVAVVVAELFPVLVSLATVSAMASSVGVTRLVLVVFQLKFSVVVPLAASAPLLSVPIGEACPGSSVLS